MLGVLLLGLGARVERLAAINGFCCANYTSHAGKGFIKIESEPVRILDASGLIWVF